MEKMKSTDKVVRTFENYRIARSDDKRNWILQEFQEGGIWRKTGQKGQSKWVDLGYYGQLKHLIEALLHRSIEVPNAPSLDEQLKAILEELKRVEKSLLEQMKVIE